MEKQYKPREVEEKIYKMWEEGGYFKPNIDPDKKPFTILLPPPNASGKMHTGNVLMIAIEDLLIRWHRMKGGPALWLPGTDHAGTETQITFEKELKKQGKSRRDFSRDELYKAIWKFVQKNKGEIENQIRSMGASVDWSRYKFTLDPDVVATVHQTFKKMVKDGLVYRGNYMVNYCPKCGTTYADVEISHQERKDPLYYLKYGPFTLATVRPETKFGDTAVAVNPKDKRYIEWIGKEIEVESLIEKFKLKVIGDAYVDPKFGTGVVKVTPAHDKNDYEAGLRHKLEIKTVINLNGRLNEKAGKYAGLLVSEARKKIVEDLRKKDLIEKIDEDYIHNVSLCKAGHDIEPMILPNWFIKVDAPGKSLKKPALRAVKAGEVKIYPKWREATYFRWMEEMHDWALSRQNVWGIRIPVWYEIDDPKQFTVWFIDKHGKYQHGQLTDFLNNDISLEEIIRGLQSVIADEKVDWTFKEDKRKDKQYLPETDTFDTWFSSGQWPIAALTNSSNSNSDFEYFYPTSVLETGWEIIRLWVSRMIMFGYYLTGKPPFYDVYLHGIVRALDGRKMSKSLGNVINPEEYQNQYGTDALRMGLISGTAAGHDFNFPRDKVIAYRNFANKLWNLGRFLLLNFEGKDVPFYEKNTAVLSKEDEEIIKKLKKTIKKVGENLEKFRFARAGEIIYHFVWHDFADKYVEKSKVSEEKKLVTLPVLRYVYLNILKVLHPFMPFVTEEIWSKMPRKHHKPLIISSWPEA